MEPSESPPQEFVESLNLTLVGREYIRFLKNLLYDLPTMVYSVLFDIWTVICLHQQGSWSEKQNQAHKTKIPKQPGKIAAKKESFITQSLFILTGSASNGETFWSFQDVYKNNINN